MPNITDADTLDAQQAKIAKSIRECACGNYADAVTGERIACNAETTRTFAPGHDAKLKGFLIRTGIAGHEVRVLGEPMTQGVGTIANRFGFSGQVLRGIVKGAKKKAAKAVSSDFDAMVDADVAKRQEKAAKMVRKPVEAKPVVTAKVGRWEYKGTVTDSPEFGLRFTYTDKKGVSQTTGKFAQV